MRKILIAAAASVLTLPSEPAHAGHGHHGDSLETCLHAVSTIRKGAFVKVEYLSFTDEGRSAYEIEVRDKQGRDWEFECATRGAAILEIEQEVATPDDPRFKARAKISEADARAAATGLYPGSVEEVEYEIEANGDASYEFDIVDGDGTEWKVEVDAASGAIREVQVEKWEIGKEDRS